MRTVIPFLLILIPLAQAHAQSQWDFFDTTDGLTDLRVNCLTVDHNSDVWMGTETGGFIKYDGALVEVYDQSNTNWPSQRITDIAIRQSDEAIFVTSLSNGLLELKDTGWYDHPVIFNDILQTVKIGPLGNAWIGNSGNGGLWIYDGAGYTIYNETNSDSPNDYVWSIAFEPGADAWVCGSHELALFDSQNWSVYDGTPWWQFTSFTFTLHVEVEDAQNIWFGTYSQGLVHHVKFVGFTAYTQDNSDLPSDHITSIKVDYMGNKWLGTDEGLVKFDGLDWVTYDHTNSPLPDDEITDLAIRNSEELWISTENNGVFIMTIDSPSVNTSVHFEVEPFTVAPNPASQHVRISNANGIDNNHRVSFYNVLGERIENLLLENESATIDVSKWPQGTYFIRDDEGLLFHQLEVIRQ